MSETPQGLPPELAIDGHLALITLRRPEVANRLEPEDLDLLRHYVETVNADSRISVLRLEGQGRHFCSGFNIGCLGGADVSARFEALAKALEQARPVTIAVLHGGVYGGATDLALACDFRFGAPAVEMHVPAARLGLLFYRGGLERYVTRLGLAAAKRVMLLAERFDADAMLRIGYLDGLESSVDLLRSRVREVSETLGGMAPLALLGMKKHMNRIARGMLDADELARDIARADASDDLREAALAWREKRAPRFTGH
ncbi:enoyl-CoA hydratase/isomerase family protein [Cupriavidus neocaledonicus]|uniref:3-hydroxybutyryl-CoA dehydratase n=1 Tax=Cupriavidus neocaledonicus TaxID=1040979 RepID=A0A375HLM4_9BURK|nr:enoyl-CoA hydratase/isomerase family protein [Cupriavidus neocaledonicus]SOZ39178.1 Enoyl-CoA hydratase/isomerase [Cupriavidus neocaledonicus]SPD59151.1 3-hydroxybutyryl-CoA dehydratase [Cupriavidus neocaledonicus]